MSEERKNLYLDRIRLAMDVEKIAEILGEACSDPELRGNEFIEIYLTWLVSLIDGEEVDFNEI